MTAPAPGGEAGAIQIALELERMRRSIDVGFTKTDGSLALLVARSDRTEQDLKTLGAHVEKETGELRVEIEALKKGRWPLPAIGALAAIAAVGISLLALLQH